MLFALLCYNDEAKVFAWTPAEDEAVMAKLGVIHDRLAARGQLGPALRLGPSASATTLVKNTEPPLVIDGPFTEAKEALLGFYVIDVHGIDEALGIARELATCNPGGAYEIRPIRLLLPGVLAG